MESTTFISDPRPSSADPIAAVPLWRVLPLLLVTSMIVLMLVGTSAPPGLEKRAHAAVMFATIVAWWLWVVAGATRRAGFRPAALSTGAVLKASSKVALGTMLATLVWVVLEHALGLPRLGLVSAPKVAATPTADALAFALLHVALLGPVAEEMLFRGALFRKWRLRFGAGKAAVVTSVLFGLVHNNPPSAALFALAMAVLYTTTRTIWAPVAAHVINNLFTFSLANSARLLPLGLLEAAAHWPLQLASLVPGLLGTWWLVRFLRRGWHTLGDPVDGVTDCCGAK